MSKEGGEGSIGSAGIGVSMGPARGGGGFSPGIEGGFRGISSPSFGGVRGGIDALNSMVSIGRVSAPAPEGPRSVGDLNNMNILAKPINSIRGNNPRLSVVNEGPVPASGLEGMIPMQVKKFNPIGEIRFNSEPDANTIGIKSRTNLVDASTAKPKIGSGVIRQSIVKPNIENIPNPFSADPDLIENEEDLKVGFPMENIQPKKEPRRMIISQEQFMPIFRSKQAENIKRESIADIQQTQRTKVALEAAGMIEHANKIASVLQTENTQAIPQAKTILASLNQEQARKVLIEDEEVEIKGQVEREVHEHEKIEESKSLHVVDKEQAAKREEIAVAAYRKAKLEAENRGITGPIDGSSFDLPAPNKAEIRGGELNRLDPEEVLSDATWEAVRKILSGRKFNSEEEVRQALSEEEDEHGPIMVAWEGKAAKVGNVAESHQRIGKSHPVEIIEKRKIKQRMQTIKEQENNSVIPVLAEEVKTINTEGRIGDYPEFAQALKAAA